MAKNGLAHDEPYLWDNRYMRSIHNGELLHRTIYKSIYGNIPKGMLVHHIDGDKLNNNPNNLELITRVEHCKLHLPRLGYRGPIRTICKICGKKRTERAIINEPHRRICSACKSKRYRENKNHVSPIRISL